MFPVLFLSVTTSFQTIPLMRICSEPVELGARGMFLKMKENQNKKV